MAPLNHMLYVLAVYLTLTEVIIDPALMLLICLGIFLFQKRFQKRRELKIHVSGTFLIALALHLSLALNISQNKLYFKRISWVRSISYKLIQQNSLIQRVHMTIDD